MVKIDEARPILHLKKNKKKLNYDQLLLFFQTETSLRKIFSIFFSLKTALNIIIINFMGFALL